MELASRLKHHGVDSFAVHPGGLHSFRPSVYYSSDILAVIHGTGLGAHVEVHEFAEIDGIAMKNTGEHFPGDQPKSIEQGIATGLVACLDPRIANESGSYMQDCAPRPARAYATSKENAEKLWKLSEKLVGQQFEF